MIQHAEQVEVLYTTNDVFEAEMVRNRLNDAGIESA
jgi:hypothetical protein